VVTNLVIRVKTAQALEAVLGTGPGAFAGKTRHVVHQKINLKVKALREEGRNLSLGALFSLGEPTRRFDRTY
jgi:hypothetical protein